MLASFLAQIVFMNLLIAILSKTYEVVTSNSEKYGLKEKMTLVTDYIYLLSLNKKFTKERFLYIIEPTVKDDTT